MIVVFGCGSALAQSVSTIKDSRDDKVYKIVKVGSQTWFAENLNYAAKGSKCYGEGGVVADGWDEDGSPNNPTKLSNAEVQANCAKYGRLYDWSTAKTACPTGWHLPSDAEWTTLVNYVGGEQTAGTKLKSSTVWTRDEEVPVGTNDYGVSALSGGYGDSDGSFFNVGDYGRWWGATEYDAIHAWRRDMYCSLELVGRYYDSKALLFSVRCVQD